MTYSETPREAAARERASRSRRRRKITKRLEEMEARHQISLDWFSEFHVRVTVAPGEAWDLWPSTTAWRRVGDGTASSHGWKKFLEAVGIRPTAADEPEEGANA